MCLRSRECARVPARAHVCVCKYARACACKGGRAGREGATGVAKQFLFGITREVLPPPAPRLARRALPPPRLIFSSTTLAKAILATRGASSSSTRQEVPAPQGSPTRDQRAALEAPAAPAAASPQRSQSQPAPPPPAAQEPAFFASFAQYLASQWGLPRRNEPQGGGETPVVRLEIDAEMAAWQHPPSSKLRETWPFHAETSQAVSCSDFDTYLSFQANLADSSRHEMLRNAGRLFRLIAPVVAQGETVDFTSYLESLYKGDWLLKVMRLPIMDLRYSWSRSMVFSLKHLCTYGHMEATKRNQPESDGRANLDMRR